MTYACTCPACGLGTRVDDATDPHEVCKCGVPYDVIDETPAALPPAEPLP